MAITDRFGIFEDASEIVHSGAVHKSFLTREFLTWLWYFAERFDGKFEFALKSGQKKSGQVAIDDRLVLTSKLGRSHEHTLKGGVPSTSGEAALALKSGKTVKELKVSIHVEDQGMFVAVLGGENLDVRTLHLPDPQDDQDISIVEQRIANLCTFNEALDSLFAKFMAERIDKLWETDGVGAIRNWIQARGDNAGTIH